MAERELRNTTKSPTGFLRLPFEIRLQIYRHCIPRRRNVKISRRQCIYWSYRDAFDWPPRFGNFNNYISFGYSQVRWPSSILRLSKQISDEALDVLYRENCFEISLSEEGRENFELQYTHANLKRMRYVSINADDWEAIDDGPGTPADTFWKALLHNLAVLRIRLHLHPHYHTAHLPVRTEIEEDDGHQWVPQSRVRTVKPCEAECLRRWLQGECDGRLWDRDNRPYVEVLCRHLSDETAVEISPVSNLAMEFIDMYLPGRDHRRFLKH